MRPRESDIENPVKKEAARQGWVVRKLKWIGRKGAPDDAFIGKGRFVLIEFKRPGETLDPVQVKEHDKLKKAGYEDLHVVDSIKKAYAILGLD